MRMLNSRTYTLWLLMVFALFSSDTQANAQGLTKEELDAQIQQNLNTPIACGCSVQDERDLDSRINSLYAILQEFQTQKQPYSGSKQTLTPAIRSTISQAVNQRINAVKDPKATVAGATTYDFGCFTLIDSAATPCLRGAIDDHESVHRAACDAHTSADWRYSQTVEDWIQEELVAYDKELKRLLEERNKRLPFCKLDPSVKKALQDIANDKEREQEAQQIADWFLGLFN